MASRLFGPIELRGLLSPNTTKGILINLFAELSYEGAKYYAPRGFPDKEDPVFRFYYPGSLLSE